MAEILGSAGISVPTPPAAEDGGEGDVLPPGLEEVLTVFRELKRKALATP